MMKLLPRILALTVLLCLSCVIALAQFSVESRYNDYGANQGIDPDTQNADVSGLYSDAAVKQYIDDPAYVISDQSNVMGDYTEGGIYYECIDFAYGSGMYIHILDDNSTGKFYTLIKSVQDLDIGQPYIYTDSDIGGRLLDDKYTSTHMAHSHLDGAYSYVSYDVGGGKLSEQHPILSEDGVPQSSQPEGFVYIYVVSEAPADYFQRLANEGAGYEVAAQSEDRAYMPANNQNVTGTAFNNWANISDADDVNYNDRIMRIGGFEGESNTRLYSYSGQNVIVAKFAIGIEPSEAKLTWSKDNTYVEDVNFDITDGAVELSAGETMPLSFHSQFVSCWGRDGFIKTNCTFVIGDESIISYIGSSPAEGEVGNTLTGLKPGSTTLTATVLDAEGKYTGGATVRLMVTVKE